MSRVLVIGGSGFVGRAIVSRLTGAGHRVTVPSRRPERMKHLWVGPTVDVVAANIHDDAALGRLMQHQDVVINLVGILRGDFEGVHARLPARIVAAMQRADVRRLLHMSALAAGVDAPSDYLRSKGRGEAAVRASGLDWTIFRPSVIFGAGDSFLNLFADLLRLAPVVPLACPAARFQPVWVEDVAAAFVAALDAPRSIGESYDLGGPMTYSLRALVRYTGQLIGAPRPILGLGAALSWLQALAMERVPGGPMTRDNVRSMQIPSVCAAGSRFPFGITPTALEAVAPVYLGGDTPAERCAVWCRRAGR